MGDVTGGWQAGTVQRAINSSIIGRPTIFDTPTTTRVQPRERDLGGAQQGHHPFGYARLKDRQTQGQPPDVLGVKSIDVLVQPNALDDRSRIDVRG
jgi:hypothetical protein